MAQAAFPSPEQTLATVADIAAARRLDLQDRRDVEIRYTGGPSKSGSWPVARLRQVTALEAVAVVVDALGARPDQLVARDVAGGMGFLAWSAGGPAAGRVVAIVTTGLDHFEANLALIWWESQERATA